MHRKLLHGSTRSVPNNAVLKGHIEPRQMKAHRLNSLPAVIAWMLDCIGINAKAMHVHEHGIRIFCGENFSVRPPTGWRRTHVSVGWPFDLVEDHAATGTCRFRHSNL